MESSIIMSPAEAAAANALRALGISYIRLVHPAASTMELCRGIGAPYGARHCKNLFLTNKRGSMYYLLLMCPDKPYRTSEVSRRLGSTRLSFAGEEALSSVLGLTQGSVSALGIVNECAVRAYREGRLRIAVDEDLLDTDLICVHPNENTESYVIKTADLLSFIRARGFEYETVRV